MGLNVTIKGKGYPLVFFHGWGFEHSIWLPLCPYLEKQHQLFLVDLPGYGLSSPMDWECFKQNLLKQLPEQFTLLGWSLGGLFATRLALEQSERVRTLINTASSPRFIQEEGWPGIAPEVLNRFFEEFITDPQQTLSEFLKLQLQNQRPNIISQRLPSQNTLAQGLDILAHWDLRQRLAHYLKPAYFIFGRLDAIVPRATMTSMQKIYPQFHYRMLNKAAHLPFLSDTEEFIAILNEILR